MSEQAILGIHGEVTVKHIRCGAVIAEQTMHNTTTNVGIAQAIALVSGQAAGSFQYVAVGSGTVTPAVTDTALTNEIIRVQAGIALITTVTTNDTAQYTAGFYFAGSYNVAECGVFNSATPNSGIILGHLLFGTIYAVLNGDQLQVIWNEVMNGV